MLGFLYLLLVTQLENDLLLVWNFRMCGTLIWILLFQVSGNDISADPLFGSFVSTSYAEMGQCTGGLETHVSQRWDIFTRTWQKYVLQTPWAPATHEGYSSRLAYRGKLSRSLGSSFSILLRYKSWDFHDGVGWGLSSVLWVKCTIVRVLRLCTGRTARRRSRGI